MYDLEPVLTSFIGRSHEIDEIGALLDDPACRLLTLVGPGGIGKTRLALEVASRKHPAFPGGIFIVPLAPLKCRAHSMSTFRSELESFTVLTGDDHFLLRSMHYCM